MTYSPLPPLTDSPEWDALREQAEHLRPRHMRDLFAEDPDRYPRYTLEAAGLLLDYSKNRITDSSLAALMALARSRRLEERIGALFKGERVNTTENRPALHAALRTPESEAVTVEGQDVVPEVHHTLRRMETFVGQIHSGQWRGMNGHPFTDVVSIGIGGSFLGPQMVSEALRPYWHDQLRCHFVANIDGSDISDTLRHLDPETTLFLVQSKSFRTQETLANARAAREWFVENGGSQEQVSRHFVAVTSQQDEAERFGIARDNVFPMWDWVGGRYSLWSAIGLPIALAVGMDNFRSLLAGAHAMDEHFRTAPLERNIPVIMGLLGLWYSHFFDAHSHAVLPYDHFLKSLPAHLQQLDMESNGKQVRINGTPVDYPTGPVIWGGAGANGQHAYHQLLHQGTRLVPVDFIMPLHSHNPLGDHHRLLFANCLSQSQALMRGKIDEEAFEEMRAEGMPEEKARELAPHKAIPGNKPSNTLLLDRVDPKGLGALIALYEHKVFVQGALWDIDSFDQWGVELGKQLGKTIEKRLEADGGQGEPREDSSTTGLIQLFRERGQGISGAGK
ncbi:glucose-6-phosphate isomerase [Halospina denitrificans]|uniref:Glucose-6-phosphate isomerase n=1 Tax=Halospina denitrificans TaxID=332522 RepID=A0A4R7K3C5_9GAMM|nr:glucose-6-phosphate isomerase [Halospina denitrificans]